MLFNCIRETISTARAEGQINCLKRFEQEVDELLDWQEQSQASNLRKFKDKILAAQAVSSCASTSAPTFILDNLAL